MTYYLPISFYYLKWYFHFIIFMMSFLYRATGSYKQIVPYEEKKNPPTEKAALWHATFLTEYIKKK